MDTNKRSSRSILFYIKRFFGAILLVSLALVFFYSAYTKSGILFHGFKMYGNDNAFDNFQWTFLDLGINNLFLTGVIARVMLGIELFIGLLLLFHIFLRSITYKVIIGVLFFFIVYLTVIIFKQGNTGNCGCFGDQVTMTPLAAIAKNIILIAVTIILWFIYSIKPYKYQEYVILFLGLVAFSLPFIINPMYTGTEPLKCGKPINFDALYTESPPPSVELRNGKHIVSFMSLTCPHCRKAAHLFKIIHRDHPSISVFFVLAGPQPLLKSFFVETESTGIPYIYYPNHAEFEKMLNAGLDSGAQSGVPAIYWINNSIIQYKSTYYQLDPMFMEDWMKSSK